MVKGLEQKDLEQVKPEQVNHEKEKVEQQKKEIPAAGFVRIKKFHFAMLVLLLVLLTAGITTFALTFKDEKVVVLDNNRKGFEKFYSAYDSLKAGLF